MRTFSNLLTIASVVLSATLAGCSDRPAPGPVPVHPVIGAIKFKGKPLADALVAFIPANVAEAKPNDAGVNLTPSATGKTNAEGKFQLTTYAGNDGAAIGEYVVTVSYAGAGDSRDLLSKSTAVMNPRLPLKYADSKQSTLKATVKAGENVIPDYELN